MKQTITSSTVDAISMSFRITNKQQNLNVLDSLKTINLSSVINIEILPGLKNKLTDAKQYTIIMSGCLDENQTSKYKQVVETLRTHGVERICYDLSGGDVRMQWSENIQMVSLPYACSRKNLEGMIKDGAVMANANTLLYLRDAENKTKKM